ncbi:universal stress protein [Halomarina ordinaria]|uniref:Universal stress protein n=1 Tax=Halomarina ordinaria TaxID=3033939 RepID=A0ABD5UIV7_9EURY|nr:universal stress protein [Halomarina sp. PSRA2]
MYSRILLPTDGSDGAAEAAETGLELATRFDASVHALSVIDARFVASDYDLVVEAAERDAERALDAVDELGNEYGVPVEKHLRRGVPAEEIVDAIGAYDVDLVVMGTHGRTGIDRLVHLGSVTERVVRAAPVHVTTVPLHG